MPARIVTVALFAVIGCLLWAHEAEAAPASTAVGDIPIAEEFWGGPPSGCTELSIGYAPPAGYVGYASTPTPDYHGPCEMQLTEVGAYSAEYICLVVVHEMGHLHGHEHSADPNSIMWSGTLSASEVPACVEVESTTPLRGQRRREAREWSAECRSLRPSHRRTCWANLAHWKQR